VEEPYSQHRHKEREVAFWIKHPLPSPLGEWRALIERSIFLSNWRGETRRLDMGGHFVTGFIGKFTYRPVERSRDLQRMMGMLAEYAEFSGVGWQTTHGLGQVRVS